MSAILKRELSAYFNSAIAYVVMAIFFGFAGFFFYFYCFGYNTTSLAAVYGQMFTWIIFIIPLITMKSFSEEKKQKTDQALLTAPVNLSGIVMGKFLAATILYAICCCIFLVFGIVISFFAAPDWPVVLCTFLGIMLMGMAMIAINVFISVLTESMIISAVVGMAVGLLITLMSSIVNMVPIAWIASALGAIDFATYYKNFTYGIFSISDVVFYLSVVGLFLFFTTRVLEKRRWS